jgi:hypothetical protein
VTRPLVRRGEPKTNAASAELEGGLVKLAHAALAALLMAPLALADDKRGPEVGSAPPTFDVADVTGPNKGKTLCYV